LQNNESDVSAQLQSLDKIRINNYNLVESGSSKFDLLFAFSETGDGIQAAIGYNSDLYHKASISRMANHLEVLLEALTADPIVPVRQLSYLNEAERGKLLAFNNTNTNYPRERSIVELFEEQVSQTPYKTAVIFEQIQLSYSALDQQTSELAGCLQQQYQVQPGDFVGIMIERSHKMIIAVLSVLKAGAAYVPIDVDYPHSRKEYIINDAAIKTLITENSYTSGLDFYTGKIFDIDAAVDTTAQVPACRVLPTAPAYVMYTSGSTGAPKGVPISHRGVVRLVKNASYMDFHQEQTLLATGAFAFDATTFEYWSMLLNGGCLIFCSREVLLDHHQLATLLLGKGVNTIFLTTGFLNQLVDNHIELFKTIEVVLTGGDKLSPVHVNTLLRKYPHLSVINCYGPTENASFSTTFRIEEQMDLVPIGKPVSNSQVYIVDSHRALVPIGVAGEICLAGDGLTSGYLNKPALTAEKFIPNPFRPGELMYTSGDLGRWLPDGNIEFLGRKDEQVKIRGYRIEPGEIESCLKVFTGITDAVVIVKNNKAAEKELVAYLVVAEPINIVALRDHLSKQLPFYMLPDHYVQLDALPFNVNGKIDKKQLPDPEGISVAGGVEYIAPRNETEKQLVNIWQELLGRERISVKDNFFDIGGHSLRATRLMSQIYKIFEVKISLRDLFTIAILEEQAAFIAKAQKLAFVAITAVDAQADYPLSSAQRRLWVLSQLQESSVAYNMPGAYTLEGKLDFDALQQAFRSLVERHESLRTIFRQNKQGEPRQLILPAGTAADFYITYKDVSQETEEALQQFIRADFQRPFDLSRGPLLRATVYQVADKRWVFTYVMHHICSDGWSMGVFIQELIQLYKAYVQGEAAPLQPLAIQYKDYASWQQQQLSGEHLQLHRSYWLKQFEAPLPVLDMPLDKNRPAIKTYNGSNINWRMDAHIASGLKALCRSEGTTLFSGLLASVGMLLHRYSRQNDIIIGSPIAGRQHADLEKQIGCYLNTLALRLKLNENSSFRDLLEHTSQVTLGAYEHQVYPFDQLVNELELAKDMSRNALFDVMIVLQNNEFSFASAVEAPETLKISRYTGINSEASKFDLLFEFFETGETILVVLRYNTDLYTEVTISRMADHLQRLMEALIAQPLTPLKQLN
ncbi:amino acid adenylation domain-containing protein, partial [uncultured Chitinophaga sp.]|uniref:amino acid adenylation domain-containing protein n=1 Tax=uncultured Chitinophaga sp. TaxID=339340 RepID=UPI0026303496